MCKAAVVQVYNILDTVFYCLLSRYIGLQYLRYCLLRYISTAVHARSLLEAAVRLHMCFTVQKNGGGPEACNSITAPSQSNSFSRTRVCEWRHSLPEATASLLAQLLPLLSMDESSLSGDDGNINLASSPSYGSSDNTSDGTDGGSVPSTSSSSFYSNQGNSKGNGTALCMPVDLEALLVPYVRLIEAERCGDQLDVETCSKDPRCLFEDHDSHSHCMVDYLYNAKLLTAEDDSVAPAVLPLPEAALEVQHICNPESFWLDSHNDRPSPLNEEYCSREGTFSLRLKDLFELGVVAGISLPEAFTSLLASQGGSSASSPSTTTLGPSPSPVVPRPSDSAAELSSSASSSPPPPSKTNALSTNVTVTISTSVCELDARKRCIPTLLSFASSTVAALAARYGMVLQGAAPSLSDMPVDARYVWGSLCG